MEEQEFSNDAARDNCASDGDNDDAGSYVLLEEESDAEGDCADARLLEGTGHEFVVVRVGLHTRTARRGVNSGETLLRGKLRPRPRRLSPSCTPLGGSEGGSSGGEGVCWAMGIEGQC